MKPEIKKNDYLVFKWCAFFFLYIFLRTKYLHFLLVSLSQSLSPSLSVTVSPSYKLIEVHIKK